MFVKELNLEVRLYANKETKKDLLVSLLLGFDWVWGGFCCFIWFGVFIPCSKCCLAPKMIYVHHFAGLFGQLQCIYKETT